MLKPTLTLSSFSNLNWTTCCIFRRFEQLSSSISWQVMVVQRHKKVVNTRFETTNTLYTCAEHCLVIPWVCSCQDKYILTLWASGWNRGFSRKKHWNTRGFTREFLQSGKRYQPGQKLKRRGKSCSLHPKKIFCLGVWTFCEWGHKWRTFRPPWPTSPGNLGMNVSYVGSQTVNTLRAKVQYFHTLKSAWNQQLSVALPTP